jgi:hypothetical protein
MAGRDRPDHPVDCNTIFALRMSNDRDQQIVLRGLRHGRRPDRIPARPWPGASPLALGRCHAGVRITFDELPKHCLPRSSTARFSEKWQKSAVDEGFLESIAHRWRNASSTSGPETAHQVALLAEAVNLPAVPGVGGRRPGRCRGAQHAAARAHHDARRTRAGANPLGDARRRCSGGQCPARAPRPPAAASKNAFSSRSKLSLCKADDPSTGSCIGRARVWRVWATPRPRSAP